MPYLDKSALCHYCFNPSENWDHIIPKSRGGPNARWNLVRACIRCNNAKANKLPTCECSKCLMARFRYCLMRQMDRRIYEQTD